MDLWKSFLATEKQKNKLKRPNEFKKKLKTLLCTWNSTQSTSVSFSNMSSISLKTEQIERILLTAFNISTKNS